MNAADALARGWAVFPVGGENCKRPLVKWRDHDPTAEKIARWVNNPKVTGYGIDCGRSGLVVLDEDQAAALAALCAAHGETLPPTFTVKTGKGRHLYYLASKGVVIGTSAGQLAPGVDVRGDGGYVVGPGSRHATGATYEVEDDRDPAPLPIWLVGLLATSPPTVQAAPTAVIHADETRPQGRALLDEACAKIEAATEGTRNDTLNAQAFVVAAHVKGGLIEPGEAEAALLAAADACGLPEEETRKTLRSAADAAKPVGPSIWFDALPDDDVSGNGSTPSRPALRWWENNPLLTAPLSNRPPTAPPTVLRVDGTNGALFSKGRVSRLFGFSGSGKTWAAMAAVVERIREDEAVLYLDTDSTFEDFADRLVALGVTDAEAGSGLLHYARPEGPLTDPDFAAFLTSRTWGLVVLDGFNNALAFSAPRGRSGMDADDVARFFRAMLYPAADAGAAVVVLDHKSKSGESHGSVHKQNDLTGTDYDVTRGAAFAPGSLGYAEIRLTHKDRGGWATSTHAKSGRSETAPFAYLIVDSTTPNTTTARVVLDLPSALRNSLGTSPHAKAANDAGALLTMLVDARTDFASVRKVRAALAERAQDMDAKRLTPAADRLVSLGVVERPAGPRGAVGLRLIPEALATAIEAGEVVSENGHYTVPVDAPPRGVSGMFPDETEAAR